jgi:TfoX/Sxy family transcriptional regulator of competence genes
MATSLEYIEFITDSVAHCGDVRYKKMFGEYMVYVNDKPLVLVCDDTAFVKILPCLDALMENAECGFPYDGAKEHYFLDVEDRDLTERVIAELEKITPLPKPKKLRTPKSADPIGEYIAAQDESVRPRLREVYVTIKGVLPKAQEKISYQMPTFRGKHNLIHFVAFKDHIGIYPGVEAIAYFTDRLAEY